MQKNFVQLLILILIRVILLQSLLQSNRLHILTIDELAAIKIKGRLKEQKGAH